MISRLLTAVAFCASLMVASVGNAHSVLVSSDPVANTSVETGTHSLRLVFDSRVDPKRSRLYLSQPDGAKLTLVPEGGATKGTVTVQVELGAVGSYKLTYEVLSIDGHIARGTLPFTVTEKK